MIPRTAGEIRAQARAVSPDPLARAAQQAEAVIAPFSWHYGPAQFELGMLGRIVSEGFAAGRFVHYVDNYARPDARSRFRLRECATARFLTNGQWTAETVGAPLDRAVSSGPPGTWTELDCRGRDVVITIDAGGDAAALALRPDDLESCEVWDGSAWITPRLRPGGDVPPHSVEEPTTTLPLARRSDGLFDAGVTVLGRPVIVCSGVPVFSSGESPQEASATGLAETRHEAVALGDGCWTTRHRLGFRYLRVLGATVTEAAVDASIRPSCSPGAFVCSDSDMTQVAAVAAWTLRTCLQGLVLDGVKRDRMPWIGDQALTTAVNAYTVADGGIIRDGLVALGRPRHGYVNGIADYSLWWVIGQGFLQRYFADREHLEREASQIDAILTALAAEAGPDAVFRPRAEGGFPDASASVLIDWGVQVDPDRDLTALQMLWFWALSTGADLLAAVDHPGADRWIGLAAILRQTLHDRAFDPREGRWSEYLDGGSADDPYPYFLGLLCGIVEPSEAGISAIAAARPRTPWMTAFALQALGLAGRRTEAVALLRERWTPMLHAGATTFWEEFTQPGEDAHAMYGRPFGKSLSHAWGAGPAALLPELVLGVVPLADGWVRFAVEPSLGDLSWASAVVPTPLGEIVVSADRASVHVEIPAGATLAHYGVEVAGPTRITLPYSD